MTYNTAVEYIESLDIKGIKLGLDRMKTTLQKLNNPEKTLKVIHVAGTNGKGSVCAMLTSILVEAGYRVGTFTSPHLEKYNEYIQINGTYISDIDFAIQVTKVKNNITKDNGYCESPTKFEFLTAMALHYFYIKKVDIVVLEVGLGGRNDSTNVIDNPLLSIITSISLDHTNILGNDLKSIAFEKAGIIKNRRPIVICKQDKAVLNIIKDESNKKDAPLFIVDTEVKNYELYEGYTDFSVVVDNIDYNSVRLNLSGSHQILNSTIAIKSIHILRQYSGLNIQKEDIYNGLKKVIWTSRLQVMNKSHKILIDGAHNVQGINALKDYIKELYPNKKITIVFSLLKDKDYKKIMEILIDLGDKIIFSELSNKRALSIENAKIVAEKINANKNKKLMFISNNIEAINKSKEITKSDELICITGSLYFIGNIKKYI